jgi:hypothetical protein
MSSWDIWQRHFNCIFQPFLNVYISVPTLFQNHEASSISENTFSYNLKSLSNNSISSCIYCHVLWSDCKRGLDWWIDLLISLPHNSELQVITVPSIISAIHKSLLQTLSLLQLAVSKVVVSWQWLLTVEILQLPCSRHSRLATVSQLN